MRVQRTTHRYPGGYVTYSDGSKGGEASVQQSAAFGGPLGRPNGPSRLHLIRQRKACGRWNHLTAILHLTDRVTIELRHSNKK